MRRRSVISLIVVAVVVFLILSALLARALSVGGAEDSAITDLIKAEARGSASAVIDLMRGCSGDAGCRSRAAVNAGALKRAGSVSIIEITPSTGFSLTSTVGTARVAWIVGGSLPRVQCVRVRHAGNVFQGFTIQLLRVSVRIKSSKDCPRRY
ncbi:MAG: hypothetical protein ACR2NR_17105 [Solirubrobacteraceae bacterium]